MAAKVVPFDKTKIKMIDMSSDKTTTSVKKVVTEINRYFTTQVKSSNIPILKVMEKSMDVENFFIHHIDLEAVMGQHVELVDRMMLSAICQYITNDIIHSIEDAKVKYVGIWDNYTIYNIAAAVVTFMKSDSSSEKFLTSLQYEVISNEDLAKLPQNSYMPFTHYTMNKFTEQVIFIRKTVVETMSNIIKNKIPMAFLNSSDRPVQYRFYESFRSMVHDDMVEYLESIKTVYPAVKDMEATEKKISRFVDFFETPFLTMMSMYLGESGLSTNLINLMLGSSRIHIQYSDSANTTMKLKDVDISYIMYHGEMNDPKNIHIVCNFKLGDILDMALADEETLSKTRKENFGKSLRSFLLNMIGYAFNIYKKTINGDQPNYTADLIPPSNAFADDDIEEDMDDDIVEGDLTDVLKELGE